MAHREEVMAIMARLVDAYGDERFSESRMEIYCDYLSDLDVMELSAAADRLVQSGKYPRVPLVSDIRREVTDHAMGGVHDSEAAWLEVKQAIRKVGFYGTPQFSHQSISDAVASLGWEALCSMEVTDATIYSAQFKRAHDSFRSREQRDRMIGTYSLLDAIRHEEAKTLPPQKIADADPKPADFSGAKQWMQDMRDRIRNERIAKEGGESCQ